MLDHTKKSTQWEAMKKLWLHQTEEIAWRQKSRVTWLKEGTIILSSSTSANAMTRRTINLFTRIKREKHVIEQKESKRSMKGLLISLGRFKVVIVSPDPLRMGFLSP